MAKSSGDQKIEADEAQLNEDVAAVESTETPAPEAPATDPAPAEEPTPAPAEAEAPSEPENDAADQAVAADEAKLAADQAADATEDLTPVQEAAGQVSNGPGQIDGSGIAQETNQEVIDNLPKNENGQVVIDSNGQIVGLDGANQPSPQPGSQA